MIDQGAIPSRRIVVVVIHEVTVRFRTSTGVTAAKSSMEFERVRIDSVETVRLDSLEARDANF